MSRRRRVGKMEQYMRMVEIERRLVKGHWEAEICRDLADEWGCTQTNVRYYIREVKQNWTEADKADPKELLKKYTLRLEYMFQISFAAGHMKVALEIQKELNRLSGLYSTESDGRDTVEVITISERAQPTQLLNSGNDSERDGS